MESFGVVKFFGVLSQYEKESTNSMAWAEYGHIEADEIIDDFTINDWLELKKSWMKKSINIQKLLANHINVNNEAFAQVSIEILIEMIFSEDIDLAYEALLKLTFLFFTSGVEYSEMKRAYYYVHFEPKYFFKSGVENKVSKVGNQLIEKYISSNLLKRIAEVKNQGTLRTEEISAFLNLFEKNYNV